MARFKPGDQVYWWKRITHDIDFPYRAAIMAVGPKRVTIMVEDPDDASNRFIRHVTAEHLQLVGGYYEKAVGQGPMILEPAASWGQFTRYLEIGEDLHSVRQVDAFENGNLLSYDRVHWADEFGAIGEARLNRNRKHGPWGMSEEIETAEFELFWTAARTSPLWPRQMATAKMASMGATPLWMRIKGWRPDRGGRGERR